MSIDPITEIRLRRGVVHVVSCGARTVQHLLLEITDHTGDLPFVLDRLDAYRRYSPALVRAVGGDRFPTYLQAVPR
jgi:hypothetical protein